MVNLPTPTQELSHPLLAEKQVRLFVKRDDLIHPEIMGNKWRKLKYNIEKMKMDGISELVTMGGAFSNHIAAVASAGNTYGFSTKGIIRGDELNEQSNPTLELAQKNGMKLEFVDRGAFKKMREGPSIIACNYPHAYFLPEGGTNELAIKGCSEIIPEIDLKFDTIICPIGTGGTFAGLVDSAPTATQVLGVSSLRGSFIHNEVSKLLERFAIRNKNYQIVDQYHFGGYGKTKKELIDFMNWFKEKFNVPLDPIYTGKSFFAVWDMIKTNKFEKNLKIVLLHTGGLQGNSGFNRKNENIIQ